MSVLDSYDLKKVQPSQERHCVWRINRTQLGCPLLYTFNHDHANHIIRPPLEKLPSDDSAPRHGHQNKWSIYTRLLQEFVQIFGGLLGVDARLVLVGRGVDFRFAKTSSIMSIYPDEWGQVPSDERP